MSDLDDLDPDQLLGDLDDLDAGLFGKSIPKPAERPKSPQATATDPPAKEDPAPSRDASKSRLMSELFSSSPIGSPKRDKKSAPDDDFLGGLGLDSDRPSTISGPRKSAGGAFDSLLGAGMKAEPKDSPKKNVSFVLDEKYKKKSDVSPAMREESAGFTLSGIGENKPTRMQKVSTAGAYPTAPAEVQEETRPRRKQSRHSTASAVAAPPSADNWLGGLEQPSKPAEPQDTNLWSSLGFKTSAPKPKEPPADVAPSTESFFSATSNYVPPAQTADPGIPWDKLQTEQDAAFRKHMQAFREKQAEVQKSQEQLEKLAKERMQEQQETQLLLLQRRQQEEMQKQMTSFMVMMQEMKQQQMISALEQQELLIKCQTNPLAMAVNPNLANLVALSAQSQSPSSSAGFIQADSSKPHSNSSDSQLNLSIGIAEEVMRLKGEIKCLEIDRDQWKSSFETSQSHHESEIQLLTKSHQSQRDLLESAAARQEACQAAEIETLVKDHEARLAAITRRHQAEIERYIELLTEKDKEHEAFLQDLENKHKETIKKLNSLHEESLERINNARELELTARDAIASKSQLLEPIIDQLKMQMEDMTRLKVRLEHDAHSAESSRLLLQQESEKKLEAANEILLKENSILKEQLTTFQEALSSKKTEMKALRADIEEEKWNVSRMQLKLNKERQLFESEVDAWRLKQEREEKILQVKKEEFEDFSQTIRRDLEKSKQELAMEAQERAVKQVTEARSKTKADSEFSQKQLQAEAALEAVAEERVALKQKKKEFQKQKDIFEREKEELNHQWEQIKQEKDSLRQSALTLKELKASLTRMKKDLSDAEERNKETLEDIKNLELSCQEKEKKLTSMTKALHAKQQSMKEELENLEKLKRDLEKQQGEIFVCQVCNSKLLQPMDSQSGQELFRSTAELEKRDLFMPPTKAAAISSKYIQAPTFQTNRDLESKLELSKYFRGLGDGQVAQDEESTDALSIHGLESHVTSPRTVRRTEDFTFSTAHMQAWEMQTEQDRAYMRSQMNWLNDIEMKLKTNVL
ncbi:unnamed protein product [Notodromas monacha]|uniref:Fas-binding factor 1 C-terminal domain-containing protein n=1 Tax=Notodromas monacha TaxID=399045 RepID=A0A7R9BFN8_9CRUS|nr:unnamed protein product [Notodromas monacha]CAG0914563.1 unnamed protein product [Notodromas monacha]